MAEYHSILFMFTYKGVRWAKKFHYLTFSHAPPPSNEFELRRTNSMCHIKLIVSIEGKTECEKKHENIY